ncbi:MAG: phosphoribosylformylglycinamidine synthase subunit PurL [Vulcanimicrobiaceae bacterium]
MLRLRSVTDGLARLALRPDERERIAQQLGREPTLVEWYAFDAQWSEHCSYKSSRRHLAKLPTSGPGVILGPGEDSGVLRLGRRQGEEYAIVIAHESHNHPSQVVPFEGAATGIGGIVRDVLCMGAEVIALADPLRFGRAGDPNSHACSVARGAVDGISAYGNAIGVPNLAGDVYFHEGFDENCLVNVVALGLVKEPEIVHSFVPKGAAGWAIVLVGKATDASGFGGASFSSGTLDVADDDSNKGAVQVPDPFLASVLMRASYRVFAMLRERGLVVGYKDLGAGGIMGCSAELCSSGGFGARIELDAVNAALPGLAPEVLAVGETQERLCWALPQEIVADVLRIYNDEFSLPQIARNACAVVIGEVTAEPRYVLYHRGEIVMDVDIDLLTGSIRDDLPVQPCVARPSVDPAIADRRLAAVQSQADLAASLLAHRDVASREPLYRRYDRVVRGATVIPRGVADAGVLAPIPGSPLGVALAVAGNPRYGALDAQRAAELAVVEAVRRVVAVGARPIGLTDCLNFGNPRQPEQYAQFLAAIDGLSAGARALELAFVSGNVSFYNESALGRAVPASAIVACVGACDDLATLRLPNVGDSGDRLVLVGAHAGALGGSVAAALLGIDEGLPEVDLGAECALHAQVQGIGSCARVVGDGGALATIAQMLFGADERLGVRFTPGLALRTLLAESNGFVVVQPSAEPPAGIVLGTVTGDAVMQFPDESVVAVADLKALWSASLEDIYP